MGIGEIGRNTENWEGRSRWVEGRYVKYVEGMNSR